MGDSILSSPGILENGSKSLEPEEKRIAKHACSRADCLLNRPSQWNHIDKKIAKFKAELAEKRLVRAMKFYLNLSLGMRPNFCPDHSTLDPVVAGWFMKRLSNVIARSFSDYFRPPGVLDKVISTSIQLNSQLYKHKSIDHMIRFICATN